MPVKFTFICNKYWICFILFHATLRPIAWCTTNPTGFTDIISLSSIGDRFPRRLEPRSAYIIIIDEEDIHSVVIANECCWRNGVPTKFVFNYSRWYFHKVKPTSWIILNIKLVKCQFYFAPNLCLQLPVVVSIVSRGSFGIILFSMMRGTAVVVWRNYTSSWN